MPEGFRVTVAAMAGAAKAKQLIAATLRAENEVMKIPGKGEWVERDPIVRKEHASQELDISRQKLQFLTRL